MGLDITAYGQIKIIEDSEPEYYFSNLGFPQSNMKDIEKKEIQISFDESLDFGVGSYGGYNHFRNKLCEISNGITQDILWSSKDETLKFYWLINFSDCEGYIGTSYCKILHKEFIKYENDIIKKLDDKHRELYFNFKEAFGIASNSGLVDFK